MGIFDDLPPEGAPLPERLMLRSGWWSGLLMTVMCTLFALGAMVLILNGKGMLAFFALFAFAPGIWLGYQQILSGGVFILLEPDGFTRAYYDDRHSWRWIEVSPFRVTTLKGETGVWCRLVRGEHGDDILISPGKRSAEALSDLMNRFRQRAIDASARNSLTE